jgi:hypothetical protein
LWSDGERQVVLADPPAFGRPARLVQQAAMALPTAAVLGGHRHRAGPEIAPPREKLTARAGRWATRQAGRARPISVTTPPWPPTDAPGGQGAPC